MDGAGRLSDRLGMIAAAIILALGLMIGGYLLGNGLVRAREADRSVTVRGLAERDVTADLATWTLAYSAQGSELGPVQAQVDANTKVIEDFLKGFGFQPGEISVGGVNVSQYTNNNGVPNITVRQRMQLRTTKVMDARRAFARQFELVRRGVAMEGESGIAYSFTKLNEVKPAMIAEATRDARAGAEQFARDSDTSVGTIKQATQGYFSIGARDGDNSSSSESPFQKVRVVTTVDFYLD